jgi:hypothetical protein
MTAINFTGYNITLIRIVNIGQLTDIKIISGKLDRMIIQNTIHKQNDQQAATHSPAAPGKYFIFLYKKKFASCLRSPLECHKTERLLRSLSPSTTSYLHQIINFIFTKVRRIDGPQNLIKPH